MFGMGFGEILVILVVAVIVLGPEKLPKAMVEVAKIFKSVKNQVSSVKEDIEKEIRIEELKNDAQFYKQNLQEATSSVRKKLTFEELDEIKKEISEPFAEALSFSEEKSVTPPPRKPQQSQSQTPNLSNSNLTQNLAQNETSQKGGTNV